MSRCFDVSLAVVAIFIGLPCAAFACGCVSARPTLEKADLLAEATVIFRGKVLAVESDPKEVIGRDPITDEPILAGSRPNASTNYNITTIRVDRVWKGTIPSIVKIKAGTHGGNCGFLFMERRRYVVFAALLDGELSTSNCTRTAPIEKAAALVARLNQNAKR